MAGERYAVPRFPLARLALVAVAGTAGFGSTLYFLDPFIGDWDGIDYTMLSLAGYPSSMALGRNLFIFGNHFLYGLAHAL